MILLLRHDYQELHYVLWFISVFVCVCVPVCVFMSMDFMPEINLCYAMLKSALTCLRAPYDHNARPSQTDRQADKDHGNSATIRSKAHGAL